MNILVINGSPKGDFSVTLQTSKLIELTHKNHRFEYLNAGAMINYLKKDFTRAKEAIERAELLIFSYPVYTFIAPAQLHEFIHLLHGSGIDLSGKYAAQITTSKHFYDVTAHAYIKENCLDLGLKYTDGLSADMDDLTTQKGQDDAVKFFDFVLWSIENGIYESRENRPQQSEKPPVAPLESREKNKSGDIVIVADLAKDDIRLASMIDRFRAVCDRNTRLVNIADFPFRGGCLSCFHCAADGKCVYNDGFDVFLRSNIQTADAIVTAFTVSEHSMGVRFKYYDDRQFCNGHRTVTMGKPVAFIVSGDLQEEENLRLILNGRAGVGGNYLAGIASDEKSTDETAKRLCRALDCGYNPPAGFLGVGGSKIFRDLIWKMQGFMRADHKFYKSHGQYDFPQKDKGTMLLMYLAGAAVNNPKIRSKMGNKMNEGMLLPYKKVLGKYEKDSK